MNKQVNIYIGDSCIKGICVYDDGRYIVEYSNKVSDEGDVVNYRLEIKPDSLRIYQDGAISTCMVYRADGCTHAFTYDTKYGSVDMQLKTRELYIDITDSCIHIEAEYSLYQAEDSVTDGFLLLDIK